MISKKKNQSKNSGPKKEKNFRFKVNGHEALSKVKELIKKGNVRRIIIKDEKEEILMEIPLTAAVIGTVFAPILAAVGALAALLNKCTIEVEKK